MHFFLKQGNSVLFLGKICDESLLKAQVSRTSLDQPPFTETIKGACPMVIHKNSTTLLLLHYQHASNSTERRVY